MNAPSQLAAVDLGSNSFHMVVARVVGRQVEVIDRLKVPVRLAAGLTSAGHLTAAARGRAIAALTAMGERLRELPPGCVRAVGTNTLRQARDSEGFFDEAQQALGHPIEIISGLEEARLIYRGVTQEFAGPERRLVIDIGGGSTELILGQGPVPVQLDSLYMGCVSYTQRYFPEGELSRGNLRRALLAARLELETVGESYRLGGWTQAIGSSGTIGAVDRVLREAGLSPEGITPRGLKRLRGVLLEAGRVSRLRLTGLPRDRLEVLPGGVAILSAAVEALGVSHLHHATTALREGVLHELLGRLNHEDIRGETVRRLALRYQVDPDQAARVAQSALAFFDQVAEAWALDPEGDRELLGWAAQLHEVGRFIGRSGYHKHGAYVLGNGDLPGFSRPEQECLAALVLGHRGRLSHDRLVAICPHPRTPLVRLVALLRLAARLHRGREGGPLPEVHAEAQGSALHLQIPGHEGEDHPLLRADLREEVAALAGVGIGLALR